MTDFSVLTTDEIFDQLSTHGDVTVYCHKTLFGKIRWVCRVESRTGGLTKSFTTQSATIHPNHRAAMIEAVEALEGVDR